MRLRPRAPQVKFLPSSANGAHRERCCQEGWQRSPLLANPSTRRVDDRTPLPSLARSSPPASLLTLPPAGVRALCPFSQSVPRPPCVARTRHHPTRRQPPLHLARLRQGQFLDVARGKKNECNLGRSKVSHGKTAEPRYRYRQDGHTSSLARHRETSSRGH